MTIRAIWWLIWKKGFRTLVNWSFSHQFSSLKADWMKGNHIRWGICFHNVYPSLFLLTGSNIKSWKMFFIGYLHLDGFHAIFPLGNRVMLLPDSTISRMIYIYIGCTEAVTSFLLWRAWTFHAGLFHTVPRVFALGGRYICCVLGISILQFCNHIMAALEARVQICSLFPLNCQFGDIETKWRHFTVVDCPAFWATCVPHVERSGTREVPCTHACHQTLRDSHTSFAVTLSVTSSIVTWVLTRQRTYSPMGNHEEWLWE